MQRRRVELRLWHRGDSSANPVTRCCPSSGRRLRDDRERGNGRISWLVFKLSKCVFTNPDAERPFYNVVFSDTRLPIDYLWRPEDWRQINKQYDSHAQNHTKTCAWRLGGRRCRGRRRRRGLQLVPKPSNRVECAAERLLGQIVDDIRFDSTGWSGVVIITATTTTTVVVIIVMIAGANKYNHFSSAEKNKQHKRSQM